LTPESGNPAAAARALISPRGSVVVLLIATAVLMLGGGLFSTLLAVRASLEGFSAFVIGLVMSGYFLGYIVGAFLCVKAIEDVGHIRTFSALAALVSAIAIAHAIFVDPFVWMAFRFLAGVCIVGLFMVIESWLHAEAPPGQRGRVFAIYMVVYLSAIAGGQLLLTLADPRSFVLFGVASMLFALAVIPTALTRVRAPAPQPAGGMDLRRLYRMSTLGVTACFTVGIIGGVFWSLAAVFALRTGLDETQVAYFMSAAIAGGMAAQIPVGRFSDTHDRTGVLAGVALALTVAACALALLDGRRPEAMIGVAFVFGASYFPLYSLAVAHTHDQVGPQHVVDATRGLMLVYGIGAVIGPVLGGALMGVAGPGSLFMFVALIGAALGGLAMYWYRARPTVPVAEQSTFVPMIRTSQEALTMVEEAVQGAPRT
jgi:MFS family permease